MLKVLGTVNEVGTFTKTKHYEDRQDRVKKVEKTIEQVFEVEKAGRLQLHIILSDATVVVVDKVKQSIVTLLNARPAQIKRYYQPLGLEAPIHLLTEAMSNVVKNLNN